MGDNHRIRFSFSMAIFGNVSITAWSWFGTNMLGVGLPLWFYGQSLQPLDVLRWQPAASGCLAYLRCSVRQCFKQVPSYGKALRLGRCPFVQVRS